MSRKGENIYKRKDGRWEGRYIRSYDTKNKAKYAYIYGKTYSEVKHKLNNERAGHGKLFKPSQSSLTYSELLDSWLHFTQLNIKESTYARYAHLINAHIRPKLGEYQVSKLTSGIIEEFVKFQLSNGRLDNSGGLVPKTVNDILSIIKSSIEYANFKGLSAACNLSKITIKKKEKEVRVLTHEEQKALISVLMDNMDLCKFGVFLSLYTGIRIGELCALQWEDFNLTLTQTTLKIKKTMQRIQDTEKKGFSKTKVIITEPKSQSSVREIPLPTFIVDTSKKYITYPKAYILTGNNRYIEPRTMQNRFKSYVKDSGIADVNFHALRHTFATRCVEIGFDIKSLSEVLGHSNVNITLNRYVHSSFELKCTNMNKLCSPT